MDQERITETIDQHGNTHTTHVVGERRSGGGTGWLVALVLVLGLVIGAVLLTRTNNAEIAKDIAIAEAADDVGAAAERAGAAVEDAANRVTGP